MAFQQLNMCQHYQIYPYQLVTCIKAYLTTRPSNLRKFVYHQPQLPVHLRDFEGQRLKSVHSWTMLSASGRRNGRRSHPTSPKSTSSDFELPRVRKSHGKSSDFSNKCCEIDGTTRSECVSTQDLRKQRWEFPLGHKWNSLLFGSAGHMLDLVASYF